MRYKSGFTLVEVLIATILVGLAIASLVGANISLTRANGVGANLSTAEFLIEQFRELTTLVGVIDPETGTDYFGSETDEAALADYDDLDDFDGKSFSPPINTNREALQSFAAFSQQIMVENVDGANFENTVADHSSNFVRITVRIFLNSKEINSTSWIRALY